MLRLAILFLVIALIAGALNIWPVAAVSIDIARLLFFVFIILAVIAFASGALRGNPPRDIV